MLLHLYNILPNFCFYSFEKEDEKKKKLKKNQIPNCLTIDYCEFISVFIIILY